MSEERSDHAKIDYIGQPFSTYTAHPYAHLVLGWTDHIRLIQFPLEIIVLVRQVIRTS